MRDRWLYNVIVFFLLLPFTFLVSYALGSLIGVGFGVALAAWRVAETPEITNPVALRVLGRTREFLRALVVGLVAGFSLLGVIDFATRITLTNHRVGSPLSYAQPVSGGAGPGWPLGCPIVYDSVNIILDYLFGRESRLLLFPFYGWVGFTGHLTGSIPIRLGLESMSHRARDFRRSN